MLGSLHVFLSVGMKANISILTAIITDIVGSFVMIHGTRPISEMIRNIVSIFRIPLNPYFNENININTVNISEAAVGSAPIPAPFASCPKKMMQETIDQTNQVYGCGLTLPLTISIKYGTLPMMARMDAMIAMLSFMNIF